MTEVKTTDFYKDAFAGMTLFTKGSPESEDGKTAKTEDTHGLELTFAEAKSTKENVYTGNFIKKIASFSLAVIKYLGNLLICRCKADKPGLHPWAKRSIVDHTVSIKNSNADALNVKDVMTAAGKAIKFDIAKAPEAEKKEKKKESEEAAKPAEAPEVALMKRFDTEFDAFAKDNEKATIKKDALLNGRVTVLNGNEAKVSFLVGAETDFAKADAKEIFTFAFKKA